MIKYYCDRCGKEIYGHAFRFEIPMLGIYRKRIYEDMKETAQLCGTCALEACRFIRRSTRGCEEHDG